MYIYYLFFVNLHNLKILWFMVSETENGARSTGFNKSTEEFFEKKRKSIETYSIVALLILITAVILISFNLKLPAGCLIISRCKSGYNYCQKSFKP